MLKNIFIESCILSLLVFGGFYINANFMKEKISDSEEKVRVQTNHPHSSIHISGKSYQIPLEKERDEHISGSQSPPSLNDKNKGAKPLGVSNFKN